MTSYKLPVVDLQDLPSSDDKSYSGEKAGRVVSDLDSALRQHGGCYVKNHGISASAMANLFAKSKEFFELPYAVKKIYTKDEDKVNSYGGYYVSQNQPFRERFDVVNKPTGNKFPEYHVAGIEDACVTYRKDCNTLTHCLLTMIARAFKKKDEYFVDSHAGALFGGSGTKAHMSSLFYHNVNVDAKGNELLMAKHTDFTTVTILASTARGLQVQPVAGEDRWVNADPRDGCVLINVGDLLERWTGGHYPATIHRVVKMRHEDSEGRQSIPYFVHPDYSAVVEPIVEPVQGKNYKPITALEYWNEKMTKQQLVPEKAKIWGALTPESA